LWIPFAWYTKPRRVKTGFDPSNGIETRFATWIVRSLYRSGSLTRVARELARYNEI